MPGGTLASHHIHSTGSCAHCEWVRGFAPVCFMLPSRIALQNSPNDALALSTVAMVGQKSSALMTSPPFRLSRNCKIVGLIVAVRKWTEPSANATFVPFW